MNFKILAFMLFVLVCELLTHVIFTEDLTIQGGACCHCPVTISNAFAVLENGTLTEIPTFLCVYVICHDSSSTDAPDTIALELDSSVVHYKRVPLDSRVDGAYFCFCGELYRPLSENMLVYFPDDDTISVTVPEIPGQVFVFNIDGALMLQVGLLDDCLSTSTTSF